MPQMAPMNWLLLYFMFIMIFMLINYMNYYLYTIKNNNSSEILFKTSTFNWKW
uniref:ATP synthase complex subunit 8 n=1 Tax=Metrius contractus TaxID=63961 RepID=A0A343EYW3_METCO|nr:ATP synthase F0 subunit 8 [Metrius contractus]